MTIDEIEQKIYTRLQQYPEIAIRYASGDPLVRANILAQATMLQMLATEIEKSELEPFIKSRDKTILADASSKGLLPLATTCIHTVKIQNYNQSNIMLQAGRLIEDNAGRLWQLMETVDIAANTSIDARVEQCEINKKTHTVNRTQPFLQIGIEIGDGSYVADIAIQDQNYQDYTYKPNWFNVQKDEKAFNLKTDTSRNFIVEFGDSQRFGTTMQANQKMTFIVKQTFGEIDVSTLKEAALVEILRTQEQKITITFKEDGLVRMGTNPLSVEQLRLLASYPTHDTNAVLLGDFDYNIRAKFANRCDYISVWNEAIAERYFGASYENMNKIFVSFSPRTASDRTQIEQEIRRHIARLDSLYSLDNSVQFKAIQERALTITIKGVVNPIHDIESVKQQISNFLVSRYGKGKVATSYFLVNGFNIQEISKSIRENIPAFQDRISDYYVILEDLKKNPIKPNQWVYLSASKITFDLTLSTQGHGLWSLG